MDQWIDLATSVMREWGPMGGQVLSIIWINILLSGDNAVVIAMACRALPPRQRMIGILLGAGAAVLLRVIFTLALQYMLGLPWLRLVGGVLLFYIAVKLLTQEEDAGEDSIKGSDNVWGAVKTVAIADMVMSLDNVLAIAGAAKGHPWLIVFGLIISIPMIVAGATLIMTLLHRFPVLVWAGAALLGWIAAGLIMEDPVSSPFFVALGEKYQLAQWAQSICLPVAQALDGLGKPGWIVGVCRHFTPYGATELLLQVAGAVIVLVIGWLLLKIAPQREKTAS